MGIARDERIGVGQIVYVLEEPLQELTVCPTELSGQGMARNQQTRYVRSQVSRPSIVPSVGRPVPSVWDGYVLRMRRSQSSRQLSKDRPVTAVQDRGVQPDELP